MNDRNSGHLQLRQWDWNYLCGEEGFHIWSPQRHDFGICFQQLCLDIPAFFILAISSAYFFGVQSGFVTRGRIQTIAINIRCILVLILTFLPLMQTYIDLNESEQPINVISYFLTAAQGISWFTHFMYTLGLRKRLGKSPRGPISVCITWSAIFALTVVATRSHYLRYKYSFDVNYSIYLSYAFSIASLVIQICYAITLLPSEGSTSYLNFSDRYTQIGENQPLLQNAYVRFSEEGDPSYLGTAMENTNWFSRLMFSWLNPLMEKGVQGELKNVDELYDLPITLNCSYISSILNKQFTHSSVQQNSEPNIITSEEVHYFQSNQNNSLLRALHKCFWVQFYSIGILKFAADCLAFAGPVLLNKLVSFIEDKSEDVAYGYLYAFGLVATTCAGALCDSHFNFYMALVALKMRAAIITLIYRKTLNVKSSLLTSRFSVGEIVNFMSTDTDRIVNSCPSFHSLWSIPLQLAITLYLLFTQMGLAFLAGLGFSIILIPINKLIANKIAHLSSQLMGEKDARVKILTEVLRGIKAIKLYVWEQHFIRKINRVREQELKYLKGRKYLDALCVYFWATTPVIISILTFGSYVLMGNKLTAATVFTTTALLNMLISPLNAFPWVLNGMTEAWVSIKRIQKLLNLPDLHLENFYNQSLLHDSTEDNTEIIIRNAGFSWCNEIRTDEKNNLHAINDEKRKIKGKGKSKSACAVKDSQKSDLPEEGLFKLEHIDFRIRKGEFIGIIGTVGSGKSTFLTAILAELPIDSGDIAISQIESGFGYVSQQPWLQRMTIRDNILFGRPYDDTKYKTVLFACALVDEIRLLPAGDLTGVGEGGTTLSGGQKARIALARAVYQDKAAYLLDDILSAVDVKVAKHIFQHCLMGLLLNKTRILCTHHLQYLVHADKIGHLENGVFKIIGRPADVFKDIDDNLPVDLELEESSTSVSSNSFLESTQTDLKNDRCDDKDSVLLGEYSNTGTLELYVYTSYWKAIGHLLSIMILVSVTMMQSSKNLSDWWLAHWVTNSGNSSHINISTDDSYNFSIFNIPADSDNNIWSYLKIYIELAVFNTLFTLIRAFVFAYGGVTAATKFHKLLLKSIMKAKSTFFDVTPAGRILNRFSSDTYTVDDSLPFILNILLAQLFGLLGSLVITIYGLPWICLVLIPLVPVYHWLQNHYRLTSRELKRISSVTLSPVYSHFNETLQGLSTIRAMRAVQRFKHDNENNVDVNIKAQFASQAVSRWLGLRLQFIGVAVIAGVSFVAVMQHQYDVADPGLVGLAITYALTITGALGGVVNAFTETEREMIAVERVNQYIKQVPSESSEFIIDPPFAWPSQGVISFNNVVLKYREHLCPSLKGITFVTRPCEKIGVVGRTGAGKSSIIAALFRMVEVTSGSIEIDSVNIKGMSIPVLRSRMFCIPQDPFLFSGSIRENLDPLCEFREDEIWGALRKVNLTETVERLGGLEQNVSSGGINFSLGQKQLICLARAVLHNAKILCIDEATASVDEETDRIIQFTIRTAFRKSTVITIAHRIQTIFDSERVLVLNDGNIVEFDSPDILLTDPESSFYKLVNQ